MKLKFLSILPHLPITLLTCRADYLAFTGNKPYVMGIVRKHPYPSYANSLNMYTLEFVTHFGWVENTPTYVSKICTYPGWVENRTSRKNTFMCRFWWWNDRSNSINYISHTSLWSPNKPANVFSLHTLVSRKHYKPKNTPSCVDNTHV